MTLRLAYVTSHPIQYQAGLFRTLAATPGIDFRAFFASRMGLEAYFDPGFGQALKWDVPLLEGYAHTFVPNWSGRSGVDGFTTLVNPTMSLALKQWGADVAIVHGYAHLTSIMAIAGCRLLGIPTLLRGESNLLPTRTPVVRAMKALGLGFGRRALAGAVAIGTLNAAYWRHYGFADARVFRAPYVVDNAWFQTQAEAAQGRAAAWRQELGLGPTTRVVAYAAKLSPVKDCATLIRAFGQATIPDSALVIVGDGALRTELEALAARFPETRVRFVGFRNQSEMPAAYAMADVFVLPSVFEPWGLVINEAMNFGCPVVVSDAVGCAPDLVGPDNGRVFRAGDADALTAVLNDLLRGDDVDARLAGMRTASRARIARWGMPEAAAGIVAAARAVARPGSGGA